MSTNEGDQSLTEINPEASRIIQRAKDLVERGNQDDIPEGYREGDLFIGWYNPIYDGVEYTENNTDPSGRTLSDKSRYIAIAKASKRVTIAEEESVPMFAPLIDGKWGRITTKIVIDPTTSKSKGTRQFWIVDNLGTFRVTHQERFDIAHQNEEAIRIMEFLENRMREQLTDPAKRNRVAQIFKIHGKR